MAAKKAQKKAGKTKQPERQQPKVRDLNTRKDPKGGPLDASWLPG